MPKRSFREHLIALVVALAVSGLPSGGARAQAAPHWPDLAVVLEAQAAPLPPAVDWRPPACPSTYEIRGTPTDPDAAAYVQLRPVSADRSAEVSLVEVHWSGAGWRRGPAPSVIARFADGTLSAPPYARGGRRLYTTLARAFVDLAGGTAEVAAVGGYRVGGAAVGGYRAVHTEPPHPTIDDLDPPGFGTLTEVVATDRGRLLYARWIEATVDPHGGALGEVLAETEVRLIAACDAPTLPPTRPPPIWTPDAAAQRAIFHQRASEQAQRALEASDVPDHLRAIGAIDVDRGLLPRAPAPDCAMRYRVVDRSGEAQTFIWTPPAGGGGGSAPPMLPPCASPERTSGPCPAGERQNPAFLGVYASDPAPLVRWRWWWRSPAIEGQRDPAAPLWTAVLDEVVDVRGVPRYAWWRRHGEPPTTWELVDDCAPRPPATLASRSALWRAVATGSIEAVEALLPTGALQDGPPRPPPPFADPLQLIDRNQPTFLQLAAVRGLSTDDWRVFDRLARSAAGSGDALLRRLLARPALPQSAAPLLRRLLADRSLGREWHHLILEPDRPRSAPASWHERMVLSSVEGRIVCAALRVNDQWLLSERASELAEGGCSDPHLAQYVAQHPDTLAFLEPYVSADSVLLHAASVGDVAAAARMLSLGADPHSGASANALKSPSGAIVGMLIAAGRDPFADPGPMHPFLGDHAEVEQLLAAPTARADRRGAGIAWVWLSGQPNAERIRPWLPAALAAQPPGALPSLSIGAMSQAWDHAGGLDALLRWRGDAPFGAPWPVEICALSETPKDAARLLGEGAVRRRSRQTLTWHSPLGKAVARRVGDRWRVEYTLRPEACPGWDEIAPLLPVLVGERLRTPAGWVLQARGRWIVARREPSGA